MAEQHDEHREGNCDAALHELYGYLDGELTTERRGMIKEHLDLCMQCFEAFDFEAELRMVISFRCRDEVPDSLRDRIAGQLSSLDPGTDPTTGGSITGGHLDSIPPPGAAGGQAPGSLPGTFGSSPFGE